MRPNVHAANVRNSDCSRWLLGCHATFGVIDSSSIAIIGSASETDAIPVRGSDSDTVALAPASSARSHALAEDRRDPEKVPPGFATRRSGGRASHRCPATAPTPATRPRSNRPETRPFAAPPRRSPPTAPAHLRGQSTTPPSTPTPPTPTPPPPPDPPGGGGRARWNVARCVDRSTSRRRAPSVSGRSDNISRPCA